MGDISDGAVVTVDLNDLAATKNLVNSIAPQTVFDCVAYGAYSFENDPDLIYQTNFQSVVNLIELLAKDSFSAYVHAGSSSEYGTNCAGPSEDAICTPNSHYAVSKVAATEYLRYMGKYQHFPCLTLRLYSVYGELEDTSRLIPSLIRGGLGGSFPPLVAPDISRDFVYVDDVCRAFIMSAAKMQPGFYGEIFNIGSGVKTTIRNLVDISSGIFSVTGQPKYDTMQDRSWDLCDWYADPSKARDQLGWAAETPLDQGLRRTAQWIRELDAQTFLITANKSLAKQKRSISAIIACYNDKQAIPVMHKRLSETFSRLGVDYELIFVDDGSPDGSAEIIRSLSEDDPRVIGISHSRNFGSQMAFRSGMELSTKDAVVLLDGDLQDPPEVIEAFYEKWEEGYDVVYGRRVKREMPWYRDALYKMFYRAFAAFSYVKIPVDAGDFSLIDRRALGWLLNCPERDLFVRGLRAYVGFRQTGVDYVRPKRAFGQSTNSLFRNMEWAKKGIFSFSNAPLTMLTSLGIVCLLISFVAAVAEVILRIMFPTIAPRGATTIIIAILLFGSFNIFAVGLVGEYVAKIFIEVKQRPRLIRSALIRHGESKQLLPDGKAQV